MNFFNVSALSRCIVYRINFQNICTFPYQKRLLHTILLLVFKIVESFQCILKDELHQLRHCNKEECACMSLINKHQLEKPYFRIYLWLLVWAREALVFNVTRFNCFISHN